MRLNRLVVAHSIGRVTAKHTDSWKRGTESSPQLNKSTRCFPGFTSPLSVGLVCILTFVTPLNAMPGKKEAVQTLILKMTKKML